MSYHDYSKTIAKMQDCAVISKILKKCKTPALEGAKIGDEIEFSMNVTYYEGNCNPTIKSAYCITMKNIRTGKKTTTTPAAMSRLLATCEWNSDVSHQNSQDDEA